MNNGFYNNNDFNNNNLNSLNSNDNNTFINNEAPVVNEDPVRSDKFKIITFLMILIAVASAGFILYKAYQNYKPKEVLDKDVPVNRYVSSIDINDELVNKLRDLIPRNGFCNNVYYAKQYSTNKFLDGDIVPSEVNVNDCLNIPSVYYINVKVVSDKDRVYIYDLTILFDPVSRYYGKNNLEYNIEYDDIELNVDDAGKASASIKSLKDYGQVYKYTFFEAGTDTFVYESTEPVDYKFIDEEENKGEPESIPEENPDLDKKQDEEDLDTEDEPEEDIPEEEAEEEPNEDLESDSENEIEKDKEETEKSNQNNKITGISV
jgi:hypothetical protein